MGDFDLGPPVDVSEGVCPLQQKECNLNDFEDFCTESFEDFCTGMDWLQSMPESGHNWLAGSKFAPPVDVPKGAPTLQDKSFNPKLSGNEVYRTNALLLLIKIMLCSKLHCQKGLNRNSFPITPPRPVPLRQLIFFASFSNQTLENWT